PAWRKWRRLPGKCGSPRLRAGRGGSAVQAFFGLRFVFKSGGRNFAGHYHAKFGGIKLIPPNKSPLPKALFLSDVKRRKAFPAPPPLALNAASSPRGATLRRFGDNRANRLDDPILIGFFEI